MKYVKDKKNGRRIIISSRAKCDDKGKDCADRNRETLSMTNKATHIASGFVPGSKGKLSQSLVRHVDHSSY